MVNRRYREELFIYVGIYFLEEIKVHGIMSNILFIYHDKAMFCER